MSIKNNTNFTIKSNDEDTIRELDNNEAFIFLSRKI